MIKGYAPGEVIGRYFAIFYTPEDIAREWPAHELRQAARTGRFEDEGWRVRKDGARFWANVIITALKDDNGEVLAYSKITRDLSERKAAEERLRQSEERFRLLVEGVKEYAIYMLDPTGLITSWNAGAAQIKGYEAHEIIGKHFSTFYSAEDIRSGKPDAELALARLHGHAEDEGHRVRKNGTRFWARVVVTPLHDEQGQLRGYAKVTQDLTQGKHAEALENVTKSINEFIAVLAHELRNPLAPIRSAVSILKAEAGMDPHTGQVVQIIDRQSAQLMRIVDDIIDVSRITRGKLAIIKKPVRVLDIVTRSVEAAQPAMDAKGHTLTMDTPNEALTFVGDEVRLIQALTNLLNNASRYTDRGGDIRLSIRNEQGSGDYGMLAISVKDNGCGIAPEFLNLIFGMFVQGEDKRTITSSGLGVGLALTRSIVELHQGSLEARSAGLGQGSEFTIRIPLAQGMIVADVAANELTQTRLSILIVDDNMDAAMLLGAPFRRLGHQVLTAFSGREALVLSTNIIRISSCWISACRR